MNIFSKSWFYARDRLSNSLKYCRGGYVGQEFQMFFSQVAAWPGLLCTTAVLRCPRPPEGRVAGLQRPLPRGHHLANTECLICSRGPLCQSFWFCIILGLMAEARTHSTDWFYRRQMIFYFLWIPENLVLLQRIHTADLQSHLVFQKCKEILQASFVLVK